MFRRNIQSILLALLMVLVPYHSFAQDDNPQYEHIMTLNVTLGEAFSVGETVHGTRFVIPITGGTFEGPRIKGEILPGGADYQLQNPKLKRTDLEAIYCIRTHDGVNIHVRNNGIISEGAEGFYFWCSPKFEAPADSPYAWLSNGIYVCRPAGGEPGTIILKVWKVK